MCLAVVVRFLRLSRCKLFGCAADLCALIGTRRFLCVVIIGFFIDFVIDFGIAGWAAQWLDGGIRPALDTGMA